MEELTPRGVEGRVVMPLGWSGKGRCVPGESALEYEPIDSRLQP